MRLSRLLFTNIPVEEIDDDPDSIFSAFEDSELCHLCRKGFSRTSKKYNCTHCKMPVCVSHSIFFDQKSRICDNCTHENLVEEVWSERKNLKDQVIKNIQRSVTDFNDKEENVRLETLKIDKLRKKFQEIREKVKNEEDLLEEEIEKMIFDNNLAEKTIEKTLQDSREKQTLEIDTVERMAKAHEGLQILKIELEEAYQENQELNSNHAKINEKQVSFEVLEIQSKLCKICKSKIFGNSLNLKHAEGLTRSVCSCTSF